MRLIVVTLALALAASSAAGCGNKLADAPKDLGSMPPSPIAGADQPPTKGAMRPASNLPPMPPLNSPNRR